MASRHLGRDPREDDPKDPEPAPEHELADGGQIGIIKRIRSWRS